MVTTTGSLSGSIPKVSVGVKVAKLSNRNLLRRDLLESISVHALAEMHHRFICVEPSGPPVASFISVSAVCRKSPVLDVVLMSQCSGQIHEGKAQPGSVSFTAPLNVSSPHGTACGHDTAGHV